MYYKQNLSFFIFLCIHKTPVYVHVSNSRKWNACLHSCIIVLCVCLCYKRDSFFLYYDDYLYMSCIHVKNNSIKLVNFVCCIQAVEAVNFCSCPYRPCLDWFRLRITRILSADCYKIVNKRQQLHACLIFVCLLYTITRHKSFTDRSTFSVRMATCCHGNEQGQDKYSFADLQKRTSDGIIMSIYIWYFRTW